MQSTPYVSKLQFNTFLPPVARSSEYTSLRFQTQTSVHFHSPWVQHAPPISFFKFDHPNHIFVKSINYEATHAIYPLRLSATSSLGPNILSRQTWKTFNLYFSHFQKMEDE
jgi:hypothetical protein